jgi:hypothetical protein
MFASLRLRSEIALLETCDAFLDQLHDRLFFPAQAAAADFAEPYTTSYNIMAERSMTTSDIPVYQSTASAPSLRSKEPMEILDRPRSSDGDANVKVVVRVRKFIKRGEYNVVVKSRHTC